MVLANFQIPEPPARNDDAAVTIAENEAWWRSVIDALNKARSESPKAASSETINIEDAEAADRLSDRFLAIAISLCSTEYRVGQLFHPQTLEPRIADKNFVAAATILRDLHRAGTTLPALIGSNTVAFQELTGSQSNLTIGLPPTPGDDVDKVTNLKVVSPPVNPARAGARSTSGWNSGRGLMVSLSTRCRHTSASVEFMRWLVGDAIRNSFAKRVPGFYAESAYAPSSSAWQAQRLVQRLSQQSRLSIEPRLPDSFQLRRSLGKHLLSMLKGDLSPEEALAKAAAQWKTIVATRGTEIMRPSFESSIGL